MPAQPSEIDAQKAALTAAIAQQGSQGQQAYLAEEARRKAAQQAAVQQIAANAKMTGIAGPAPAEFTQSLQGQQRDLGSIYAQDAAMSQQTFQNSIANTQASNAAYMDAARAAVPVVNAQTAGTVARIRAEQEAEREARAYEERMRQQEEEFAREERNVRRLELEMRRKELEAEANGLDPEAEQERQASAQADIIAKSANLGPVGQEVLRRLVNDAGSFQGAATALKSYGESVVAENPEVAGQWNDKTQAGVLRALYNFYNVDTGRTAPSNPAKFGNDLLNEGLNPEGLLPGYFSPQDALAIRQRDQASRQSASVRNNEVRKAVQEAIAAVSRVRRRRGAGGRASGNTPSAGGYSPGNSPSVGGYSPGNTPSARPGR